MSILKRNVTGGTVLKGLLIIIVVGACVYAFEHWGDRYISRISDFVASQGEQGIVVFIAINALATMIMVPQGVFSVMAGVLFGWKFGTAWASVAMTLGAVGAFFIARYGVKEWLRERFRDNHVYRKMQSLSRSHPLHVISLSRLIPVIPFPLASYLLGVTEVRSLPYAFLTWVCMLPETLFLASGGHLLNVGLSGKTSIEAAGVLCLAAVGLVVIVHRMKQKFLEEGSNQD
ncbi:VTT domain-containing protein [Pseudodesulfovibrio sp. zrk46]|uniref:TVP38/TMEM64 family protein n=1 Tax=Pseudodesulfovibrio sp. zrk46 TaxID=2725288 RepID=UPI0014498D19|nr:VTT domain-containing protein [Pseudodesulfovibrio sp. zrk46]QJB58028.1 TVP38/TMEM64 family protein [Pseudodesulfovibrio sp. zrk46]